LGGCFIELDLGEKFIDRIDWKVVDVNGKKKLFIIQVKKIDGDCGFL
jgi:hypothetical protein